MSDYFKQNLLMYLPSEFAIRDMENNDLDAFLEVVAISLDEFDNYIEQFVNIFNVDTCEEKYLPYLAKMVNYPLSDRDSVESKRLQIKNAVEWYKRKGLHEGFRILFYSLGYIVNLAELWTRDYKSFYRYPGLWTPPVFQPSIIGTNLVMMTINESNRNLRISIDGGNEIEIQLTLGTMRTLASIASEINTRLFPDGLCSIISDRITISSLSSGASANVKIVDVAASAYTVLGFPIKISYGIDYNVPSDYYELLENGGKWYKSPHFGIEVFSIKDYVTDQDEFSYIRSRIELIRPAHTVLDWILYAKELSENFEIEESEIIGTVNSNFIERWPFPICMDRGEVVEYEYIRNGLVPDRFESTRISYKHRRKSLNNCESRSGFVYEYFNLSRQYSSGPPQMANRGVMNYYRGGFPYGEPRRSSCQYDTEELTMSLDFDDVNTWCSEVLRRGGLVKRDNPSAYLRDGSFTTVTWRGQSEFVRGGDHDGFNRSICKPPMEVQNGMMFFRRADLQNVWFPSLESLSNPDAVGIIDLLPGPGEQGPNVVP